MSEGIDEILRSKLQQQGIWVSSMQELYNWGRKNSIWPLQFGLACCAIEMIATAASRYDLARFGGEVFRPSPRQGHLMIVAGSEVCDLDGRVRDFGRAIQAGLQCAERDRPLHPGGRLHPRLPAAARSIA